jgi:hypothetical protein
MCRCSFAYIVVVVLPDVFVGWGRLDLLSLLDILGEFSESSIEAFLVGIVEVPLLGSFGPILRIIIFGEIRIGLVVESLIVRCEGGLWGIETIECF